MDDQIIVNETNIFDKEEIFYPCTVQVLTNTITGEVSVGWWHGAPNEWEEEDYE